MEREEAPEPEVSEIGPKLDHSDPTGWLSVSRSRLAPNVGAR